MIKAILYISALFIGTVVSVYSLSVPSIDNGNINFSAFKNKKILIVNVASGSAQAPQLADLEQLYRQHKDSLVIIAFPSNSFGKEPKSNYEIKTWLHNTYNTSFPIAGKITVNGNDACIVYQWLADSSQNEFMNGKVKTDFVKFLVDKKGALVGIFDSSVKPLSNAIQQAIHNSN